MSDSSEEPEGDAAAGKAIVLPTRCDLAESEVLFDKLCDIGADETVVINAAEVEHMSTPCVLAIVSAIRFRAQVKPPVAVVSPAQPFMDAFQALGLYPDMMKMEFRT